MKLIALLGAGAVAAGTMMEAGPADAQRYGYSHHYGRYDRSHYDARDRYRPDERDRYRHGYGFRHDHGYGRSRFMCRMRRGYYGPVRRCFRIYR